MRTGRSRRSRPLGLSLAATVAAALVGLWVTLPASPAYAEQITVQLDKQVARPGDQVYIRAACKGSSATAASAPDVFTPVAGSATLTMAPASSGGGLFVVATIKADAPAGSSTITVKCDGGADSGTVALQVTAPVPTATRGPNTGGGGTAGTGAATPLLVTGGVLIVLGAGLAFVLLRRRPAG